MEKPPSLAGSRAPRPLLTPSPPHSFSFFTTQHQGCTYREKQQYDRLETVCRLEKLIITSVCLRNLISLALTHSLFSHRSPFTLKEPKTALVRGPLSQAFPP